MSVHSSRETNDHYSCSSSTHHHHSSTTGSNYKGGKGNRTPTKDTSSETRNWKKESSTSSGSKGTSSSKSKVYHSNNSSYSNRATSPPSGGGGNNSYSSSRFYYRDMPPRFQSHNKKSTSSNSSNSAIKTTPTSKSQQQGNNKRSKDSRWSDTSTTSWTSSTNSATTTTSTAIPDIPNHSTLSREGGGEVWTTGSTNNSWNNHWISDEDESFSNSDPIADEIVVTNHDLDSFSNKGNSETKRDFKNEWSSSEHKKLSPPPRNEIQSPESLDSETGQEGGGVWRSGRNSMGSSSSIGSNSSWKGSGTSTGGGNRTGSSSYHHHHQRSASPRKQVYSSQRSTSVSSSGANNGGGSGRSSSSGRFVPKKKPIMDLDDAIESLHCEPSGWGELPSPKQSGIDMGTELWGIPDDMKQKMKKGQDRRAVGGGGATWSDRKQEWGTDVRTPSTSGSGWIDNGGSSIQDSYQWGEEGEGWNSTATKGKERTGLGDKVKILVDMGFSPSSCEKALKVNNDNFEAALGDLLALTAIKETEATPPATPPSSMATPTVTSSSNNSQIISPPSTVAVSGNQWQQQLPTTGGLDLINIQQILAQQLTQYKLLKQKLMIQMSQLKSTTLTPQQLQKQQQFLTANMNQVNLQINTVHQQYVAITKLIQQKVTAVDNNEKEGSKEATTTEPNTATNEQLTTSLQNMSLDQTDISKSSALSLSRFQQIINSQESEDEQIESNNVVTSETPSIAPPTSVPTRFSTVRSVDDIPEFKPGVPWKPSQATTPNTEYSNGLYEQPSHSSNNRFNSYNYGSGSSYEQQNYGPTSGGGPRGSGFPFNRSASYSGYAVGGGGGGYKNGGTFNGGTQQKIPPVSPSQNYLPNGIVGQPSSQRSSSHYKPRLMQQNSYNGPFNTGGTSSGNYRTGNAPVMTNNKLTPTTNQYGGSNSTGGTHGKWSFDGNPWGMPATSGSIWSMESSDSSSILNSTAVGGGAGGVAPGYTDWRSGGRKPSLPLQLSAPTNYILLKNVTSQIDETSLREVCSEYGQVLSCSINPFNESVLIRYGTKEEAALAKAGLEKNPSICGIYVSPNFASEIDIATFTDQRTPSHHSSLSLSSALEITSPSWLPQQHKKAPPTSLWGNNPPNTVGPNSETTCSSSSSVWSNGGASGTLASLTSPWSISPPLQQQQQIGPQSSDELISTSPPISTFLPNGLF